MASLNPLKLAIFALVISGIVSRFGAQMVIEEVVRGVEHRCSACFQECDPRNGKFCCGNLVCVAHLPWPPVPGTCVGPSCSPTGDN